jgi:hypothetical protein
MVIYMARNGFELEVTLRTMEEGIDGTLTSGNSVIKLLETSVQYI